MRMTPQGGIIKNFMTDELNDLEGSSSASTKPAAWAFLALAAVTAGAD
jgi:hypothetical protein